MAETVLHVEDVMQTFEEGSQRVEVLKGISLDVNEGLETALGTDARRPAL